MTMDLNILARTLAEKWRRCCGSDDLCQRLERDIREAIDKTLEEAKNATCALCKKGTPTVNHGQQHRLRKSCTPIEFYYVDCLAAAIRSLKQS